MMGRVVSVSSLRMVEIPEIKCSENSGGLVAAISVVSLVSYVYPPAVQNGRRRA